MSNKSRRIFLNVDAKDARGRPIHQRFCSNRTKTTKYTMLTFPLKNLYEQFRSVANFYFLSLVILQTFDVFKLTDIIVVATPIVIIVAATAAKDAVEDYRRYRTDVSVNTSLAYVLRSSTSSHEESEEKTSEPWYERISSLIVYVLHEYFLYPTHIVKRSRTGDNEKPPVLLASDYLPHEKPRRMSCVARPSTAPHAAPTGEAYWKLKTWENIKVGDYVLLRSNESIPADIAIISTSEQDCVCYVETKNLDGETNLKIRKGIPELAHVRTPNDCAETACFIDVEAPNEHMYTFSGAIRINPSSYDVPRVSVTNAGSGRPSERKLSIANSIANKDRELVLPITINGVLLRGCILRNTDWAIGVVVYTGDDTKLVRNSGITPSKRSKIERQLNPQVLLNFMILFALCFICGILGAIYQGGFNFSSVPFAILSETGSLEGKPAYIALIAFFMCMIIFQNIVPIALYISIEAAKTLQVSLFHVAHSKSFLIYLDDDMYDEESDSRAQPRTWNLCDDLGQIEYIFSDKTGTLTCNVMEFRKCSINGVLYGNSYVTEATQGAMKRLAQDDTGEEEEPMTKREQDEKRMKNLMQSMFDTKYVSDKLSFVDPLLPKHLKKGGDQALAIKQFFALLSLCHTVLSETYEDDPNAIMYKAQSPDEKALVEAARDVGFAFTGRRDNEVNVNILGEDQTFTIQHVIEFNSDRKRMSVILKPPAAMNLADGDMLLFCKGADAVIFERLSPETSKYLRDLTTSHLESFANEGLRTLCLAFRIIPKAVYEPWAERYRAAQSLIKDREAEVDRVADQVERDLQLMGATAIEDKLQDGVPASIATLAKAGIKIWVLTGDKMETAINIGFSCNLLEKNMTLIVIRGNCSDETQRQLREALTRFWDEKGVARQSGSFALIIDGGSLMYTFDETNDRKRSKQATLLELACRCKSVICCRNAMCLAIGDGANDVSMIQEADVGVGISGKEGLQAVMSSDYAISQFRFLTKLLLVHGRWAYVRVSEMILLYFYKNVVFLFVTFCFTADIIVEYTYGIFFNTVFSLLPNIIVGVLDQDVNANLSLKFPGLYGKGIRQELYTMERFWLYIFDAIYQSVICYYSVFLMVGDGAIDQRGWVVDKNAMGNLLAFHVILSVNIYMGINNLSWNFLTHICVYATILAFIIYAITFASVPAATTYGLLQVSFTQPGFYLSIPLTVITALLPRLAFKAVQQYFFPEDTDIVREIQKYNLAVESNDIEKAQSESVTSSSVNTDSMFNSGNGSLLASSMRKRKDAEAQETPAHAAPPNAIQPLGEIKTEFSSPLVGEGVLNQYMDSVVESEGSMSKAPPDSPRMPISPATPTEPRFFTGERKKTQIHRSNSDAHRRQPSGADLGTSQNSALLNKTQRVISGIQEISGLFISPITTMSRNVGDFMKSVPRRLRMGSLNAFSKGDKNLRASSLVFMGTQEELTNTGFAFSHEQGMEDVITPARPSLGPLPFEDEMEGEGSQPMGSGTPSKAIQQDLRPPIPTDGTRKKSILQSRQSITEDKRRSSKVTFAGDQGPTGGSSLFDQEQGTGRLPDLLESQRLDASTKEQQQQREPQPIPDNSTDEKI